MSINSNQNALDRLTKLINNDLDYLDFVSEFRNLIELAKNISGLKLSMFNVIDANYILPISQWGVPLQVMDLKDFPCQFTIKEDNYYEVKDLTVHDIFKYKNYVQQAPFYKYYFGLPLRTLDGINIGTICFLNTSTEEFNIEQIKLLGFLAKEVVIKIENIKSLNKLHKEFFEYRANQRIMANDLRNPLAGIIGLSDVLIEQFDDIEIEEAKDYNKLINSSSKSILSTLDDIIINQKHQESDINTLNLETLKARLIVSQSPLLLSKNLKLVINFSEQKSNILFLKSNVSYLVGSLIAEGCLNLVENGLLTLSLDLIVKVNQLYIKAEYFSDDLQNTMNLRNEVFKVYQKEVEELGGELLLLPTSNQLYEFILPLKNI